MTYTVWGDGGSEFTLAEGEQPPAGDTPGLHHLKTFEASSWEDAARQYHEWQGWEPYRPPDTPHVVG